MKILFVVTRMGNHRAGGHVLSAASLGKALVDLGHEVHFAFNSKTLPEYLAHSGSKCLFVPVARTSLPGMPLILGYWSRSLRLAKLALRERYDLIVAMDSLAAWHASIPACLLKIRMIPVIAGGANVRGAFPHSSIFVFSSENKEALLRRGWDPESIVLCEGRIDFSEFIPEIQDGGVSRSASLRLLYLTRLHQSKRAAFHCFVRELERLSHVDIGTGEIVLEIAGDGPEREMWMRHISNASLAPTIRIRFLGYRRITGDFLRQYHMVVTMGRGVLEAISSGVPAAICGPMGYMGLVTDENLDRFARSNFTGRGLAERASLGDDLRTLLRSERLEHPSVALRAEVIRRYSSQIGARTLLYHVHEQSDKLVPAGGSIFRLLSWHARHIVRLIFLALQGRLRDRVKTSDQLHAKEFV